MTEERLVLADLLEKAGDGDFLRAVAEAVLQLLMESDLEGTIGAGRRHARRWHQRRPGAHRGHGRRRHGLRNRCGARGARMSCCSATIWSVSPTRSRSPGARGASSGRISWARSRSTRSASRLRSAVHPIEHQPEAERADKPAA